MLIGGENFPFAQNKMWTYNFEHKDRGWVKGPYLNTARSDHACGIMKDSANEGIAIVVVAGGCSSWNSLETTEYIVLGTKQWRVGPDLKYCLYGASGVTTPDGKSFLLVGGAYYDTGGSHEEDTIYKLECHNLECTWTKVNEKLQVGRQMFLAAFLPDSLLGCCSQPLGCGNYCHCFNVKLSLTTLIIDVTSALSTTTTAITSISATGITSSSSDGLLSSLTL